ncbi:KAP family P-loop NTPase fold protein [Vibrio vulnificus]|uniref:KAP family P-loop NTPase fold protein n=1 Tax=Vibrio vulnificus TaxID=672 RepID=UPI000B4C95CC|nr:P-loop NTPase fold protein [Vibrio vulnificus]ASC56514.1 Putative phage protein [Vibrio vulnificus]EHU9449559.1 NTPase KAP [Vibrio vulnificus]EHV9836783.1 NTPase KAP [Vibrio vulnificus]
MTQKIEMHWNEDVTVLGEHCPADKLDRAKYAQFLTGFLAGQGFDETKEKNAQKKNYVLNLNSEWGSGKTYFLKRWYHALKPHYPVVYVDAWKQDYSDDPLMTVISSMIKQLREQAGKKADDPKFKVPRKAIGLLKAALPSAAGALAKRYLGIDPVSIMEAAAEGDVGEKITDAEGKEIDMGTAASKAVQYLLDEHDAKSEAITSLKTSVTQWIDAVNGAQKVSYPAFIFIDELDRCRPSYAVEMLETIKHIFDIPGVVFVVGTDTEQLQHTVRAIYGDGFDAMTYLGRFFNSRCTLKKPSFKDLQETHCDMHKLTNDYFKKQGIHVYPTTLDAIEELGEEIEISFRNLTKVFEAFNLQARQVIQITNRLISIIDNLNSGVLVDVIFLTFLLCLKEKKPNVYDEILKHPSYLINLTNTTDTYKFITQESQLSKTNIYMKIDPVAQIKFFLENETHRHSNRWPKSHYTCTLLTYTQKILDIVVSNSKSNFRIDSLTTEAFNLQRQNAIQMQKAEIWIGIEFANMHKKHGQSLEFYKNLVDLSSALDSVEIKEKD